MPPRPAKEKLGWTSTTTFEGLVKEMVEYDMGICLGKIRDHDVRIV
jgi:GDP-D-mannose dehydratase